MKIYNWTDLKKIVAEQKYKMAALQNNQGDRIVKFNPYKKTTKDLEAQFEVFKTRLKSEANPDGVYYVMLAYDIQSAKNPIPYAITKGKVAPDTLAEAEKKQLPVTPTQTVIIEKPERFLSVDNFMKMQAEIVDLKNQVNKLTLERDQANKELNEYELAAELDEDTEPENKGLLSGLSETVSSLIPAFDRWANLEEKKLDLRKMEIELQANNKRGPVKGTQRKEVVTGSQEHMELIERLYNSTHPKAEEQFNKELDKLEEQFPEMYTEVCKRLNLEEEEEEGGTNEQ